MSESGFRQTVGALLLGSTILLAILLAQAPGTPDVAVFTRWMEILRSEGIIDGYATIVGNFGADGPPSVIGGGEYPPLIHVVLHAAGSIGARFALSSFVLLKSTLLVFHLASVLLVLGVSGSFLTAAAFSAAVLLNGPALGYLDLVFAPSLIGALWLLRAGRTLPGLVLLVLALLLKWQPIIVLPFVLIHVFRIPGRDAPADGSGADLLWRMAAFGGVVLACVALLFGRWPLIAFLHAIDHPHLSGNALNLPWLASFAVGALSRSGLAADGEVGILMPPTMSMLPAKALFLAVFAAVVWRAARSEKTFANCLLFSVVGSAAYCALNTGVHENHWFLPFVLALVLMMHAPSDASRTIALLMAAMLNINLFLFYGVTGEEAVPRVLLADLSVPMALFFVIGWIALALYAWKATRPALAGRHGHAAGAMAS
jgi:hypothetical protein